MAEAGVFARPAAVAGAAGSGEMVDRLLARIASLEGRLYEREVQDARAKQQLIPALHGAAALPPANRELLSSLGDAERGRGDVAGREWPAGVPGWLARASLAARAAAAPDGGGARAAAPAGDGSPTSGRASPAEAAGPEAGSPAARRSGGAALAAPLAGAGGGGSSGGGQAKYYVADGDSGDGDGGAARVQEAAGAALAEANERLYDAEARVQAALAAQAQAAGEAEALRGEVEALKGENLEAWRVKYELERQLADAAAAAEGLQREGAAVRQALEEARAQARIWGDASSSELDKVAAERALLQEQLAQRGGELAALRAELAAAAGERERGAAEAAHAAEERDRLAAQLAPLEGLRAAAAASTAAAAASAAAAAEWEERFMRERGVRRRLHEQLQARRPGRGACISGKRDGAAPGQAARVYEEVSPLVRSCADGFNAAIIAYGQTGSGKTFTMDGPPDALGVNARALQELFAIAADEANGGWSFQVAMLEIYNEAVRDLLAMAAAASAAGGGGGAAAAAAAAAAAHTLDVSGLPAGELPAGMDRVPGLLWRPVRDAGEVQAVLREGARARATAATALNANSSRSHAVLSVRVCGRREGGAPFSSLLHLVDLAGSERVDRSEVAGQQLREAQAINRSLSALGDVIAALQRRGAHVPFRNSKLTQARVLADSLSGSSKVLLVCCCSPEPASASETLSSLNFAARAAQVELGAARRAPAAAANPAGDGAAAEGGGAPPASPPRAPGQRASFGAAGGGGAGGAAARPASRLADRPGSAAGSPRQTDVDIVTQDGAVLRVPLQPGDELAPARDGEAFAPRPGTAPLLHAMRRRAAAPAPAPELRRELTVVTAAGQLLRVEVTPGVTTGGDLRREVARSMGSCAAEVRLAYAGKELDSAHDGKPLALKPGLDAVQAVERQRGGAAGGGGARIVGEPVTAPGADTPRIGTSTEAQLAKQFRHIMRHPMPGISAAPDADDPLLAGPEGTPYAGGWWHVRLMFSHAFPGRQPCAKFVTPILNPYVDERSGVICFVVGTEMRSVACVLAALHMLLRKPALTADRAWKAAPSGSAPATSASSPDQALPRSLRGAMRAAAAARPQRQRPAAPRRAAACRGRAAARRAAVLFDGVTAERGFLPEHDPLLRLPPGLAAYEEALDAIPKLALGSPGTLRRALEALPPFDLRELPALSSLPPGNAAAPALGVDGALAAPQLLPPAGACYAAGGRAVAADGAAGAWCSCDAELWRAYMVLSFLCHAHVWCDGPAPPDALPARLAQPWAAVSAALGMPPVLVYATYNLMNWRRLDAAAPVALGNLACQHNFLGGLDEEWFRAVHVTIEAAAAPALAALRPLQAAAERRDAPAMEARLGELVAALQAMQALLSCMGERCDPHVYYTRVRLPMSGWRANPKLPRGLVYGGLWRGAPQQLYGETGAQSSVVPALDAALGIEHERGWLSTYLAAMRAHMPPAHRAFLDALEAGPSVRGAVRRLAAASVTEAYDAAVGELAAFRAQHRGFAAQYIAQFAAREGARGTGGSDFMPALSAYATATGAHRLAGAPAAAAPPRGCPLHE
ncbi:KIN14Q [Scenedesmus sp. PABB004]|nr:KIN14Q [Scenedesmus sp. PABB004]